MLTRISKKWLKDFVDFDQSDNEIAEILSLSGTLVEKTETSLANVVIGEIKAVKKHPDADKLQIATVFDGGKDRQIVCGAKNIAAGQKVPLALPGAKLGEIEIKEAEIRGIVSEGMLCSEKELSLGEDHSGILILDNNLAAGAPFADDSDTLFDLEITPNRGDCLSHLGVAREIAANLGRSIRREPIELSMNGGNIKDQLSVEVLEPELCPTYLIRMICGVKIAESPAWLKERLSSCGIAPINNIVDITNYIMLDLGQPMHAFDAAKISSKKIVVRLAKKSESIVSFDGNKIDLEPTDLLITDGKSPIAVAGVVGGIDSGISESTTDIILEAASFDPKSVRKTMKRLSSPTDAGLRFERGVDPNIADYAINKAAKMIREIAGGKVSAGMLKHKSELKQIEIPFLPERINTLLGTDIDFEDMSSYLRRLGFAIAGDKATVPSWRPDCRIWQDLAEEVVRLYGINNVSKAAVPKTEQGKKGQYFYKEHLKDLLVSNGYTEAYNYSFMSDRDVSLFDIDTEKLLEVANPIAPENRYMRDSLVYGLLKNVAKNNAFDPILLFEIGKIFDKKSEHYNLCVMTAGKDSSAILANFTDVISKSFKYNPEIVTMTSEELAKYKIKKKQVSYFEIDLSEIERMFKGESSELALKVDAKKILYRNISKYPSVVRDLAFIVNKDVKSSEVGEFIKSENYDVILSELFDEFASDKLGIGKKNLAYHIHLQSASKTLTDTEADAIINDLVISVEKKFKAKLRKG